MATPDPEGPAKVSPETVGRMAREVVATPVAEKDRKAAAEVVQALAGEMAALRAMPVGEAEPATVYDAGETES